MPVQHDVDNLSLTADEHNHQWNGSALVVTPDANGHKLTGIDPRGIVQAITEQLIINGSDTYTFILPHNDSGSTSGYRFKFTDGQDHEVAALEILRCLYVELPVFVGWLVEPVAYALAASIVAGSTSGPTYSSSTPAVIAEMTSTVTARGGHVIVAFDAAFDVHSGDTFDIMLYRDGSLIAGTTRTITHTDAQGVGDPAGDVGLVAAISTVVVNESPGSHTYDVRWSCSAGVARAVGTQRSLRVLETSTN